MRTHPRGEVWSLTITMESRMPRIPRFALVAALSFVAACMEEGPDTGRGETALGSDKVTICHVPPGNPGNAHELTVGASAVSAHQAHGDALGLCGPACAIEGAACVADADCCLGQCGAGGCRAVSVRGVVWEESGWDGLRGSEELRRPNVKFELYDAATGRIADSTISELDGSYTFYSVTPGAYFITVAPPLGWGPTPIANANANANDDIDSDFDHETLRSPTFTYTGTSITGIDCGLVSGT